MIIAIDGPAASGKSTTAQGVAKELGFLYLDTGAMYRAVTLAVVRAGIDPENEDRVKVVLPDLKLSFKVSDCRTNIYLGDEDVSDEIRSLQVTQNVSAVSAIPAVRKKMVSLQREIAGQQDSVVEGRDVGTVVFPDADFKFFITADYKTRAIRRKKDLEKLGVKLSIDEIIIDLKHRDRKDSTRNHSPLLKAEDAVEVDTTTLTIKKQIELIVTHIKTVMRKEKSQ